MFWFMSGECRLYFGSVWKMRAVTCSHLKNVGATIKEMQAVTWLMSGGCWLFGQDSCNLVLSGEGRLQLIG